MDLQIYFKNRICKFGYISIFGMVKIGIIFISVINQYNFIINQFFI